MNGASRYDDASGAAQSHASRETQQDRRVYVGNLSYEVKWHQLKDYMRGGTIPWNFSSDKVAGEVVHAEVLTLPNGMSKVGW